MSKPPEPTPAPAAVMPDPSNDGSVSVMCMVRADVAWRAPVLPGYMFDPPEEGSRIMKPKERARVPRDLAVAMELREHVLIIEDK